MAHSLLVRAFERATGTKAKQRTAAAVSRFGPYLVGMIAAKGLSTLGQLLVSRWLGPTELGQLALVLSTATLLASPLAGAWGATFVRYAAGQPEHTWVPLMRWTERRVLRATVLLAAAASLLAPILSPLLRVPTGLLVAGAALALAMALWLFAKAACQGRENWRRFIGAEIGFGAVVFLLSGILLTAALEPSWWPATLAFLAAYLVGSTPGWSYLRAAAAPRALAFTGPTPITPATLEYGRFALLTGSANTILLYSDRFAAQQVLGFAELGVYQVYNFATVGVGLLASTMLYNFIFPLFAQGDRRAFAALFRTGFLRLVPLALAGFYLVGSCVISLTGFPFRPGLLALATLTAVASVASGFYGNLVASIGVTGVRRSAAVAVASVAIFAIGIVPAVWLGGLAGLFALYAVLYMGVAAYYDRLLRRMTTFD